MKENIMISVVIPTYNRINTLRKSIDSVLNQTYSNIEVIIVDDGSDDGTQEYIRQINDDRVRYIRNNVNLGPAGARNVGASIANGQYIAFQDSDDEWKKDKLEKQIEKMQEIPNCKLVYCEIGRWEDDKFLGVLPSKSIPFNKKQGDLFEYLLLYPLISTQTILVEKKAFMETKFDESLQSLEDYEFSVRFSNKFIIGFVDEDLVDVHDMPGSVNKRWSEKIITQMHILLMWVEELRNRRILMDKIALIKDEAESYGLFNVFSELMINNMDILVSQNECDKVNALLGRISLAEQENNFKIDIYNKLLHITNSIKSLYENLCRDSELWSDVLQSTLLDVLINLIDYMCIFGINEKKKEAELLIIKLKKETDVKEKIFQLKKIYCCCIELEKEIKSLLFLCNVCGNKVFFKPISDYYEKMRRANGFLYWNAVFQLENKKKYECPKCKAFDRDRLIIAFLDCLETEKKEKIRLLQIAPSYVIENYAKNRSDIIYESTDLYMNNVTFTADIQDMYMVRDETYDVIICSHVLEHVEDDAKAILELKRILRPKGLCIVLVPLIVGKNETDEKWGCSESENWRLFGQGDHARLYGKRDFINKFESNGFFVNELGEEWFGKDFFEIHGFDQYSLLYVMTKDSSILSLPEVSADEQMNKKVNALEEENRFLCNSMNNLREFFNDLVQQNHYDKSVLNNKINNCGYEIMDKKFVDNFWLPKIMSVEETVYEIVHNHKSIARFGDGEFGIIAGISRWRFQRTDEGLANRLKEVLSSNDENILIGLIDFYGSFETWTEEAANGARAYLTKETRKEHYALLDKDKIYANTSISRNETWECVKRQKQIWEKRDCVFIEGYQTRMGVANDLFDNAASIERILCPAESAFDKYDLILEEALRQPKDKLMLIALGPTATVLAYDLAKAGYQAIDIGHADISYEWMLRGKFHGDKTEVPYKYNNEVMGGYMVDDIFDEEYAKQIIADFH